LVERQVAQVLGQPFVVFQRAVHAEQELGSAVSNWSSSSARSAGARLTWRTGRAAPGGVSVAAPRASLAVTVTRP